MALSKAPNLRKLSLRGCLQINEFVPYGSMAARFGFKKLEYLDLGLTPITDSDLQCFNTVLTLKVLLIESPEPNAAAPVPLKSLKCKDPTKFDAQKKPKTNYKRLAAELTSSYLRQKYTRSANASKQSKRDSQKESFPSLCCGMTRFINTITMSNCGPQLSRISMQTDGVKGATVTVTKSLQNLPKVSRKKPDILKALCETKGSVGVRVSSQIQQSKVASEGPSCSQHLSTTVNTTENSKASKDAVELNNITNNNTADDQKKNSPAENENEQKQAVDLSLKSEQSDASKGTLNGELKTNSTLNSSQITVGNMREAPSSSRAHIESELVASDGEPSCSHVALKDLTASNESLNESSDERKRDTSGSEESINVTNQAQPKRGEHMGKAKSPSNATSQSLSMYRDYVVNAVNNPNGLNTERSRNGLNVQMPNADQLILMQMGAANERTGVQRIMALGNNPGNVEDVIMHPMFWDMLNVQVHQPAVPADAGGGAGARDERANGIQRERDLPRSLHERPSRHANVAYNFRQSRNRPEGARREWTPIIDTTSDSTIRIGPARMGLISDRSICSFGRPQHQVEHGMIWIGVNDRPNENCFERLILRNYKFITDFSLSHLVQCSPNLIYIDVTGTSVTLGGVQRFCEQKPLCHVVANHLRNWMQHCPTFADDFLAF